MQWHNLALKTISMPIPRSEQLPSVGERCVFEVSNVAFIFFQQLDMLMRKLLSQHLVSGTISQGEVTEAVVKDEDLLF